MTFNEEHVLNIEFIEITFSVLNEEKSSDINDIQ